MNESRVIYESWRMLIDEMRIQISKKTPDGLGFHGRFSKSRITAPCGHNDGDMTADYNAPGTVGNIDTELNSAVDLPFEIKARASILRCTAFGPNVVITYRMT